MSKVGGETPKRPIADAVTNKSAPVAASDASAGGATPTEASPKPTGLAGLASGALHVAADTLTTAFTKLSGAAAPSAPSPALDAMRSGAALLKKGSKGPAVAELQRQLNAAGANPPLGLDGKFGANTEGALRTFQRARGLAVDGKVGPKTMGQIDGSPTARGSIFGAPVRPNAPASPTTSLDPSTFAPAAGRASAPFAANAAGRTAQAESLLKANGQWPPKEGHVYAIQIDQDSPPADASRSDRKGYLKGYSGQTAVYKAVDGKLVEQGGPFTSASHPGQMSTDGKFTDVNKDKKADIAHLRAGVYEYKSRPNGSGRFNPTDNRAMKVGRDINHDGVIAGGRENEDFFATGLQIHAGNRNGPSSVGCQTMPPSDYADFQRALKSGGDETFTYLLARRPNDVHGENVMPDAR